MPGVLLLSTCTHTDIAFAHQHRSGYCHLSLERSGHKPDQTLRAWGCYSPLTVKHYFHELLSQLLKSFIKSTNVVQKT